MVDPASCQVPAFRIGAVSRLTGIPSDTLRMWERRYSVVDPGRADSGSRMYTREDIRRLAMVKRLVDAGHAIGTVAHLDEAQLDQSLNALSKPDRRMETDTSAPCRIAVLGDALSVRVEESTAEMQGLEVVGAYRDKSVFERSVRANNPHLLLLEYPTIHDDTVREIWRLFRCSGAQRLLIVYAFGPSAALNKLEAGQAITVRAPVAPGDIRRICLDAMNRPTDSVSSRPPEAEFAAPIPARRFDYDALARISAASTTVKCECPHHLSDLILSVTAFEDYSAECESRNSEDAALHAYLHVTTARARKILETALTRLVEAEGLEV